MSGCDLVPIRDKLATGSQHQALYECSRTIHDKMQSFLCTISYIARLTLTLQPLPACTGPDVFKIIISIIIAIEDDDYADPSFMVAVAIAMKLLIKLCYTTKF